MREPLPGRLGQPLLHQPRQLPGGHPPSGSRDGLIATALGVLALLAAFAILFDRGDDCAAVVRAQLRIGLH